MSKINKIRQLRMEHSWSQEQLAELASLSVRTIQRVENGSEASLETLSALAAIFNVKVSELIDSEECKTTQIVDMKIAQAKEKIKEQKKFYKFLLSFIILAIVLFIINLVTSPSHYWFYYPMFVWSIILIIKVLRIFIIKDRLDKWETNKINSILKKEKSSKK